MPITIDHQEYFSQNEITEELGIARSTLWRWRDHGDIPQGQKRRGKLFFNHQEREAIKTFANTFQPTTNNKNQLGLFKA